MADRAPAFEILQQMFAQYGLTQLGIEFAQLLQDTSLTDAQIYEKVYELPAYKARFPAMDALRKSGDVWTEQKYIQQENAYRRVLEGNDMPASFYDSVDDFAAWMKNGVAPDEVNKRVQQAKRLIDSSDPTLADAASRYYGIDKSLLAAYVLDPEKAQPIIDKQMRIIETGAAAAKYGFELDKAGAEDIYNDPTASALTQDPNVIRQRFSAARELADQDTRLAGIDQESYDQNAAIDAVLKENLGQQRASQKRYQRETARFSGQSAGGAALSSRTGTSGI